MGCNSYETLLSVAVPQIAGIFSFKAHFCCLWICLAGRHILNTMQLFFFSTHRNLWESVSQFTNAIAYVDIDNVQDEDGKKNSCFLLLLTGEIKSLLINLLWLTSVPPVTARDKRKRRKRSFQWYPDQSDWVNWARKIHQRISRLRNSWTGSKLSRSSTTAAKDKKGTERKGKNKK